VSFEFRPYRGAADVRRQAVENLRGEVLELVDEDRRELAVAKVPLALLVGVGERPRSVERGVERGCVSNPPLKLYETRSGVVAAAAERGQALFDEDEVREGERHVGGCSHVGQQRARRLRLTR